MGLILTLILGGLAGWIASMIMNRDQSMGIVANVIVGILGAILANWVIAPIFGYPAVLDRVDFFGFLLAVLGAVGLLLVFNLLTRNSAR